MAAQISATPFSGKESSPSAATSRWRAASPQRALCPPLFQSAFWHRGVQYRVALHPAHVSLANSPQVAQVGIGVGGSIASCADQRELPMLDPLEKTEILLQLSSCDASRRTHPSLSALEGLSPSRLTGTNRKSAADPHGRGYVLRLLWSEPYCVRRVCAPDIIE